MGAVRHQSTVRIVAGFASALLLAAGLTIATEAIAPTSASAAQDPTSCQGSVALTNGTFETPAIPDATYRMLAQSAVPGWSTTDSKLQIEYWSSGFQGVPSAEGRQFAELNANSASMLYQDVATTPGQTLAWSLKHRGRNGVDVMRVVIGAPSGPLVQNGPNLSDGNTAWGTHTGSYTVPAGQTTTRFGFEAVSAVGGASQGNFLDDITFGTGPCLITTKNVVNLTRGGTTAEVGDVLRYTVTTRNDGGNPALQSVSTDQLASGIDFVPGSIKIISGAGTGALTDTSGDDRGAYTTADRTVRVNLGDAGTAAVGGSIGVGASTSYTFDAKVNVSAAAGVILNEAKVAFRDNVVNQDRTSTSQETQTPVNPAADLAVTKTLDTSPLVAGRPASFTMTVTNNGPQTATGVTVTDPIPAGLTGISTTPSQGACTIAAAVSCTLADLAVGQSETIQITGTVSPSMDPGAALTNTATVSGTRTDPNPGNNTATASGTVTTVADVSVEKTFVPTTPVAGEGVTYTLTTRNAGPSDARGVTLADPLDPGTSFISASTTQGSCTGGASVDCAFGTLAPGASVTTTVVVQIASGTTAVVQNSASVTSSTSDSDPSNNVDSTSFQPEIIADLAVTKTASAAQVSAGDPIDFTITATNLGSSQAQNAMLLDRLPVGFTATSLTVTDPIGGSCTVANGTALRCIWGAFPVGATVSIVVHATVDADAPVGTLTNTAAISSPAEDPDTTNNASSVDVKVVQNADLRIAKTAPATGQPGSPFAYTLTVTNDGPSVARGATLSDTLPAEFTATGTDNAGCTVGGTVTCALGDLGPGASVTVVVSGTWGATATGTIRNTATTTSATPDSNPGNNTSSVDVALQPSADLVVTKTTSTPSMPLGGGASFRITVHNGGPSAASGVIVDDAVPPGYVIATATPSTGTWSAADSRWTVGTLLPGDSATLDLVGTVHEEGTLTNTATGSSQTPDPNPGNNTGTSSVIVTASADLSIVKTASVDPAPLNGAFGYTIIVTNNGPSTAAGAVMSDPLPAGLRDAVTTSAGCVIVAGLLHCDAGALAVGATFTATVTGTVDPALADPTLSNTATVTSDTSDPDFSNNTSTVTVPVSGTPRVALAKSPSAPIDANANGRIDAGDRVDYTFTVTNTGNVTLTSAAITDPLLGGAVACPALNAPLAPGGAVVCAPVPYTLTQADLDAGTVHNTASVLAQSARGTADANASADVTIPAVNSIVLTKAAGTVVDVNGDQTVNAGDSISYTFTVTNTGTTTLRNARITDPMLGGAVTCAALQGVDLAPGQSVACLPVSHTLTQDDIDRGVVRNTGTVNADDPRGATVTDDASAVADIERTAGISLTKRVVSITDTNGDGRIGAGDTVEYMFEVRNTGITTLTDLTISDPLVFPGCGVDRFFPGTTFGCGPVGYTLTQADIERGFVPNTATTAATSPLGPVGDSSSANVVLVSTTAIALTKTAGTPVDANHDGMIGAGDTVDYTFTVRNTGTAIIRDLALTDPLLGGAVDCPALNGLDLAPQAEVVCGPVTYALTQTDIDAGTVHNTATVKGDSRNGPAEANASADVEVVGTDALALLKSAAAIVDANGNGRTDAGDTIAYTFTVTNTGTTTLHGVAVTDPRLTGDIVCESTTLAPGEATLCAGAPAVLTQAEIDAGRIVNTATATGTGTGEEPPTAESTVTTPIAAQPAIALVKTGGEYVDANGNSKVDAGDTVAFRFTVTNTGAVTLTGIVLSDPLLGGAVSCTIPDLAPGQKADCGPVRYALTAADVAKGAVVNVATVSGNGGGSTVTGAASATVDLTGLAVTGGVITGLGWALALLAIGALVLLVTRIRRGQHAD